MLPCPEIEGCMFTVRIFLELGGRGFGWLQSFPAWTDVKQHWWFFSLRETSSSHTIHSDVWRQKWIQSVDAEVNCCNEVCKKYIVSVALAEGGELPEAVLSRMWEAGLLCVQLTCAVNTNGNGKDTTQVQHSCLECSYVFDFWNIEMWMVFNKSDGTCRKK